MEYANVIRAYLAYPMDTGLVEDLTHDLSSEGATIAIEFCDGSMDVLVEEPDGYRFSITVSRYLAGNGWLGPHDVNPPIYVAATSAND